MCGIAGIWHFRDQARPVDPDVLAAMTRSLAHRGPDGEGAWIAPGVGLGFGHRRLSIIDLSDDARQPMTYADGALAITFNGEIYNFRELRAQLEARGRRFRSRSDTEVILAAYAEWGENAVERLSGIFGLALWDARRRCVLLARDALGVKPLFYALDGHTLRFGSEIKAILSDPAVGREPDLEALDAFLTFGYTPAPLTGFRRVRQLLPGHAARVDAHGWHAWRFWPNPYGDAPRDVPFDLARREFEGLLDRVTRAQLVSDVPVGCFLSGGLDSAAVVRAAKRAGAGPLRALTVGFDVAAFDERAAARATAQRLGVDLEEQCVSIGADARRGDRTLQELLPVLSRHVEEPTADSSMVPVHLLCRTARERFTVALAGDGADELLAGYDTYRAAALAEWYRRVPRFIRRGLVAPLAARIPIGDGKYGLHQTATRFVAAAELGPARDHAGWRVALSEALKRRLFTPAFRAATAGCDAIGMYAEHVRAVPRGRDRLSGLLNADTEFYLPNDMLVKVDRMSMACGLEVRVPLLDVELVRFCADLPSGFKLHRGKVRKHILRETLRGSIPDRVLDRPKSGFNAPLESWMRGGLGELLGDVVRTRRGELGELLRLDELSRMADEHRDRRADHAHALFAVLMLGLWLDNAARAWREPARVASPTETTSCAS